MLKRLTIDALRGATKAFELTFDPGKRISIIYGENGCGKSTVCDALEFIADQKVTSLEDRGLGQTARYWVATGRKASDVHVGLETKHGKWEASLVGKAVLVKPEKDKPRIAMLRRKQILELVCAAPSSRFEAIRPFIDIEAIETGEKALNDLIKNEKHKRVTAVAVVDENRRVIEEYWKQAGSPSPDALAWAKAEAQKDIGGLDKELELLAKVNKAITDIASSRERWVEKAGKALDAKAIGKKADEGLKKAKGEAKGGEADVAELLHSAAELLHEHPAPEVCPLCESKEKVQGLAKRVGQRLALIEGVTKAMDLHRNAKAALDRALAGELEERKQLKTLLHKFSKALASISKWPKDATPAKELMAIAKQITAMDTADEIVDTDVKAIVDLVVGFDDAVSKAKDQRHGQKAVHTQLRNAVGTYAENYTAQLELDKLMPRYQQVLEAMADERRAFVDSILQRIAVRVGELYEMVHPGERLSRIELQLDPDKRASLEIGANFPGATDARPQAFFSDSHLDTLGLCMFLALAELDDAKNKIVVLDDVLGSVDEPHVDRVVNMLYDTANGFQHLMLTTHYKPWRELFRWGYLKNGECHFIELVTWSHAQGMKLTRSVPPLEKLRGALQHETPDPQEVCALGGIILEAVLDFLTLLYRCKVPRQDGGYTVGDLLNALNKPLKAGLKAERLVPAADGSASYTVIQLGPTLEKLLALAGARNVFGCHFNELAQHLHDSVAINFGKEVLELADAIVDPEYGWPRSDKSGSYWANKKETRRLHPLKQPV